ncbi:MAG: hypothetical protein DRH20_04825 [Deltaproteobacteria bacterium]|nr:MAG: hypothetical protein DRH20_04825 [Deltaproteobacteria bacterium]
MCGCEPFISCLLRRYILAEADNIRVRGGGTAFPRAFSNKFLIRKFFALEKILSLNKKITDYI